MMLVFIDGLLCQMKYKLKPIIIKQLPVVTALNKSIIFDLNKSAITRKIKDVVKKIAMAFIR